MGPAGAGKTTVGRLLAQHLGVPFEDADSFHAASAVEKMRRGEGLTDEDRQPWLAALARRLESASDGLVLACSALKASYRARLGAGAPHSVGLAYLAVPEEILRERLAVRSGHFAGPALLESQLASLELPTIAETYDGTSRPEDVAREIARRLAGC